MKLHCILVLAELSGAWGGEASCLLVVLAGLGFSRSRDLAHLLVCAYGRSAGLFPLCLEADELLFLG